MTKNENHVAELSNVILVVRYILFISSIYLGVLGFFESDKTILFLAVLIIFLNNIIYSLEKIENRIILLAFSITFYTFLLGGISAEYVWNYHSDYFFSDSIWIHTEICLFIALFFIFVFYSILEKSNKERQKDLIERYENAKYKSVRRSGKIIFYVTYVFYIICTLEKVIFVKGSGYLAYYTEYSSSLPYTFVKIGDMANIAFLVFLATMPTKKEAKWPIILYLAQALLALGAGKRSSLIIPLLTIIIYFIIRNKINPDEKKPWFGKKELVTCIILVPIIISFMYIYNIIRLESDYNNLSLIQSLYGFFEETGFSVNVINYGKLYEANIPNKIYSFGTVIDYLRENVITQLFLDLPVYKGQTVEKALNSHNFSQIITYIPAPNWYLNGHGYGSSYIAESYHDFGYFGIVLFSLVYSFVMTKLYDYRNKRIIYVSLSLIIIKPILMAPRFAADAFLAELINFHTWIVIFVIFVFAKIIRKKV